MAKEQKVLTRDDILNASDIEIKKVDIPEWGGVVYVKAMTAGERDAFESSLIRTKGKEKSVDMRDVRAKLCAQVICKKDGKRLFTPKDVRALSDKSAGAVQRIFEVAQELSGLSDEDAESLLKN